MIVLISVSVSDLAANHIRTTMKLRLRNLESRETLKLELLNPPTLHDLKLALALSLPPSSLPLHLSLNRKDELRSRSPGDADFLHSLGITSGDLIFYTHQDNAFATARPPIAPPIGVASSQEPNPELEPPTVSLSSKVQADSIPDVTESGCISDMNSSGAENFASKETLIHEGGDSDMKDVNPVEEGKESGTDMPSSEVLDESQLQKDDLEGYDMDMDMDMDVDVDVEIDGLAAYKYSEPYFLRRVLREELGDDGGEHRLLVIAVHAVMLESGFVAFDSVTGTRADRFHLPDQWPSSAFTISLWYTLPDLLVTNSNVVEGVVLKFQSLGHFLNVYGSLAKGNSGLHRVCLDEYRFAPTIDLMWANCDKKENSSDRCSSSYPDNEVFEFWKILKDGLALPLLIDLSERAGLSLPSCFMCLPTELKLQIFELLPAVDLAKVGCANSELRYLSSNKDLWKKKFEDEFGEGSQFQANIPWKVRFASYWEVRKKKKRDNNMWRRRSSFIDAPFYFPVRRDPNPLGMFPNVIGGDYDRLPGLGVPSPYGRPGAFPRFQMRRNVIPGCNLGRRNI